MSKTGTWDNTKAMEAVPRMLGRQITIHGGGGTERGGGGYSSEDWEDGEWDGRRQKDDNHIQKGAF